MRERFNNPKLMLVLMAFTMPLTFNTWMALLNNFAIEVAQFSGREIGILQSLREVPGFLAFTAVFVLLVLREQTFALLSLAVMCAGVAAVGYFPTVYGLYATTVIMSIGFHYFETINKSLTLQWLTREEAPAYMGKLLSVKGAAALVSYGGLWLLLEWVQLPYREIYLVSGAIGLLLVIAIWLLFPRFPEVVEQHKTMVFRKRYWLYYVLTFLSGARRQIFVVFAGFLLVEKFGYSASEITLLYLVNHALNMLFAGAIGRFIGRVGERRALLFEYAGLVIVFASYGLVESGNLAAVLYVVDHLFFAMAIAIHTYFQKIADPKDIAATASVSFTINHIAAVVLPAALGLVWLVHPAGVFYVGAAIALTSLLFSTLVPRHPDVGNETTLQSSQKTQFS